MEPKVITIGEVLMRLTTLHHNRFLQSKAFELNFGGAEANVALCLSNWGVPTTHITALPNNDIGKNCLSYLKSFGLDCSQIFFDEGRLGIYYLENGAMQRSSKIIYDRFNSVFSNYDFSNLDYDEVLKGVTWLHYTGITPAISQSAALFTQNIVLEANKRGVTISGDINYRRNLWQYGKQPSQVMPNIIANTHILIGNEEDFKNCLNINENDFENASKQVFANYPTVQKIATTVRLVSASADNELSALLIDRENIYSSKTYQMKGIVDRIGGGDAFMAGLIYGLIFKNTPQALEFGVAASVLKHSILGDANLCSLDEVTQIVNDNNIGKLLR